MTILSSAYVHICHALVRPQPISVDHGIEMTQNTLSNIERGERIVRDSELAAFSDILGVNPTWLLFGDKPPKFDDKPLKAGN
ncbi:MAG: helix-turn-helix transcriptional regulator [Rickettsiales bacterium]|nr:helix-turn-helix transcriptional regulator [Pseudomonadota bacterium]MDA0965608.1 helix-turn-helix transcriptional regulator [Pseudomonadota bacterium]MDG4542932.1 helix-turn-helix transcriptional regulator [Rickettsiales bacterium]MDG4544620.1 helix-turn-helix transcriptional regulator [Rickettsiales bacterium]